MKMKLSVVLLMVAAIALAMPVAVFASVTDDVKKTVDEVVKIVSDKELKKTQNEVKRRKALKNAIGGIFDYGEMARRSLGVHWKEITPVQQKEFVGLFETLLENSYSSKIESYNQEKIVYQQENVEGENAEVRSRVISAKRDEYSLDYRLLNKGGHWKVYDVIIEGVSLVSNYRTQFNKIIQSQGYAALVKKLKTRSEEIKAL